MMAQGIRSQNTGMPNQMNSLPNNPSGMNNMRMGGPNGQVSEEKTLNHKFIMSFLLMNISETEPNIL